MTSTSDHIKPLPNESDHPEPYQANLSELQLRLKECGMDATDARIRILTVFVTEKRALSAQDILESLRSHGPFDKVTLYRTLDLFADKGVIQRHSAGDRSFRYCMSSASHSTHSHFYCTKCGRMDCLPSQTHQLEQLHRAELTPLLPGRIEAIEIRLDGICDACLSARI